MRKTSFEYRGVLALCRPTAIAVFIIMAGMLHTGSAYTVTTKDSVADGLIFTMSDNSKMKVQVCTDKIIRIVYTVHSTIPRADSNYIVVKAAWTPVPWTSSVSATAYSITTATLRVDVSKTTGAVTYSTASGTQILQETAGKTLTSKTVGTLTAYEGTIPFNSTSDEGIYGFGQFQNSQLNQRGLTLTQVQLNQMDCSPFFMSTRGFGVLWINYSEMTVNPPLTWWSDWATNDAIDYYFIYGPEFDQIIGGYRTITGPAVMWPKWAYGFWQCRNYYPSQSEIMRVVNTYRADGYPIDNIVQDWQYYPSGGNGCQCFDLTRYPDPTGMIKTLHDSLNCHFTMSVWPSFTSGDGPNFTFMSSRGYLLNSSDALGQTYDAFNDSAAFYYWKFINDSLVSKGVDGFWPDATEPEFHTQWVGATTAQGPAEEVENIFPLLHSRTLYNGYRAAHNGLKRVCNLTRSYYAGSQRLGAAYWTGDIPDDFNTYTTQIPALLNVCATGLPMVCTDVGGFDGAVTSDVMTRWFEWGAFCPVFRVHGSRDCNEVWCWGAATEQILAKYSKLRYRLFPYVYSVAWKVTNEGYTMMRALPFDFRNDATVRNLSEYMFGPALLVCPIISSTTAATGSVYLPAGTWYDFWTGTALTGAAGRIVTAQTPMETMPLYVRAGSIIPMGPDISHADTAADPIELRVYTGADGSFNIYEDEGDGYAYENGTYATIPVSWNESTQDLTIYGRSGSFPGMLSPRKFNVVFVAANHGTGGSVTSTYDTSITYNGTGLVYNKVSKQIQGVRQTGSMVKNQPVFAGRLVGRNYVVTATGAAQDWKAVLISPSGKLLVSKRLKNDCSLTVAENLPSGVYFAYFKHGAVSIKASKIIVP
jgi:Alpha-glucosidases, family 31 of glycosyl hydrolases